MQKISELLQYYFSNKTRHENYFFVNLKETETIENYKFFGISSSI